MKLNNKHWGSLTSIIVGFFSIFAVPVIDQVFFCGEGNGVVIDYCAIPARVGSWLAAMIISGALAYRMRKKQKFGSAKWRLIVEVLSIIIFLFSSFGLVIAPAYFAVFPNDAFPVGITGISHPGFIFPALIFVLAATAYLIVFFGEPDAVETQNQH